MDSHGLIAFANMTRGPFAGLLRVAVDGYRWDDSLVPSIFGAGAQRDREDGQLKSNPFTYDVANDKGPWLVEAVPSGVPRDVRQYAPLGVPGLHRRFAGLSRTRKAILRFANRYGRLGHGVMLQEQHPASLFTGESFGFWDRQIVEMGLLLALWDLVEAEDRQMLSTFVRWQSDPRMVSLQLVFGEGRLHSEITRRIWRDLSSPRQVEEEAGVRLDRATSAVIAAEHLGPDSQALLANWAYGDEVEPVRYYVHREINQLMRGHVSPGVLPFRGGDIYFFPDCLLSALYVHFALEVSGRPRPQIACKGCGRYFRPSHGRRYCNERCRKLTWYHNHSHPREGQGHDTQG